MRQIKKIALLTVMTVMFAVTAVMILIPGAALTVSAEETEVVTINIQGCAFVNDVRPGI